MFPIILTANSENSTTVRADFQKVDKNITLNYQAAAANTSQAVEQAARESVGTGTSQGDNLKAYDPFFTAVGEKLGVTITPAFKK